MKTPSIIKGTIALALLVIASIAVLQISMALPQGATMSFNSSGSAATTNPVELNDSGGTITILKLATTQQDSAWKGYVGNVSGLLTLDDALGNTIYNWQLAAVSGHVFASRSSSVIWSNINCSNQSHVDTEQSALSFASSDSDSINRTFNSTNHQAFLVAARNMSSCRFTPTYVNDSFQAQTPSSLFQEVLLSDGSNFVYSTDIESTSPNGFDQEHRHFQLIVPQSKTTVVPTGYYFYIELS